MRKIILASVAVTALVASLGAVKAEEPAEQLLLSQRGTLQGDQLGTASYGSAPWASSEFSGATSPQGSSAIVSERYGPLGYVPIVGPAAGGLFFGSGS